MPHPKGEREAVRFNLDADSQRWSLSPSQVQTVFFFIVVGKPLSLSFIGITTLPIINTPTATTMVFTTFDIFDGAHIAKDSIPEITVSSEDADITSDGASNITIIQAPIKLFYSLTSIQYYCLPNFPPIRNPYYRQFVARPSTTIEAYRHRDPSTHYTMLLFEPPARVVLFGLGFEITINTKPLGVMVAIDSHKGAYMTYRIQDQERKECTLTVHKAFWSVIPFF
jgi:hypothetical protein